MNSANSNPTTGASRVQTTGVGLNHAILKAMSDNPVATLDYLRYQERHWEDATKPYASNTNGSKKKAVSANK